jgi:hypothetical protein
MTSAIDATKPITGTPTTQSVRDQFATARDEITALQAAVAAQGVPTGGTAGQVLSKIDTTNYNTQWSTPTTGGGSGTVTSVAAGTGLTASPSPITGAGTMSLATPVSIANGGTNATTAGTALNNLGAAPLASPVFTGDPQAPTPAASDNDTSIATTAFVAGAANLRVAKTGDTMTGNLTLNVTGSFAQFSLTATAGTHAWIMVADPTTPSFSLKDNATSRIVIDGAGGCFNTTGTWAAISDASLKENVTDYTSGLAEITKLRPVTFSWKMEGFGPELNYGLIAQEVEAVMPELVGESPGDAALKTIDYGRIIFSAINALREISQRLDAIEARLG